jgi:trigger factor
LLERLRNQVLGPRREWPEGEKDKLREKFKPKAEDDIRLSYLLHAIAEAEKIEVTAQELEAEKTRSVESAQDEAEKQQVLKLFDERAENLKGMLRERKVMEFLKSSAVITEA